MPSKVMSFNASHPQKAADLMVVTLAGSVMLASTSQREKIFSPITSKVEGRVTFVSLTHAWNT